MATNRHVIIACFPGADKADSAANQLISWDKAHDSRKLGRIGILVWQNGKPKTRMVGGYATKLGAKWGVCIGACTGCLIGVLSAFVTLIGGTLFGGVIGAAFGAVAGALFYKGLDLTNRDEARLEDHLKGGGAVLVVSANESRAVAINNELASMGGTVEDFTIPVETVETVEKIQPIAADTTKEDKDETADM